MTKEQRTDIIDFVADCLYGNEPEPMTVEDAAYTIREWNKEGGEYPEGLTPEIYANTWNILISTPAIFVHDTAKVPYSEWIVTGLKIIETRTLDVLKRFVGQRVLIVRTRAGKPSDIVGSVLIKRKQFCSAEILDEMRDLTWIPEGSAYDCKGAGKWCYVLKDPRKFDRPVLLSDCTVSNRTRSFCMIAKWEE